MFGELWQQWGRILWRGILAFGALLLFFFVVELLRLYQIFSAWSPWLAGGMAILVLGWIAYQATRMLSSWYALPRAPKAPDPLKRKQRYRRYLVAQHVYLRRLAADLASNPHLSAERRDSLTQAGQAELAEKLTDAAIEEIVLNFGDVTLEPALAELDAISEKQIRSAVAITVSGVILLPFRSADLLLVAARSWTLFMAQVRLYHHRPTLPQVLRMARDTLTLVGAVNLLGFSEQFISRLLANVPVLDKAADDILQGVGAGIAITAVGRASARRCRAMTGWDPVVEKEQYRQIVSKFTDYVKAILSEDVMPKVKGVWHKAWDTISQAWKPRSA